MKTELLEIFVKADGKVKKILVYLFLFFTIHATVGFACFILEEGMQTLMFASFNYKNVEDWKGLEEHIRVMDAHAAFADPFMKYVGWLAPFTYPSYLKYIDANQAYIESLKATVRAELY